MDARAFASRQERQGCEGPPFLFRPPRPLRPWRETEFQQLAKLQTGSQFRANTLAKGRDSAFDLSVSWDWEQISVCSAPFGPLPISECMFELVQIASLE
jgi:hypothetical protein